MCCRWVSRLNLDKSPAAPSDYREVHTPPYSDAASTVAGVPLIFHSPPGEPFDPPDLAVPP